MGELDKFGKNLMRLAAGELFADQGPSVHFRFGPGAGTAWIDGSVAGCVAVEIESRTPKQVRGALIDLILHPYHAKLLLLLPAYTGNPHTAVAQAEVILGRFVESSCFRVVCATPETDDSVERIRQALRELGVPIPTTL